MLLKTFGSAVNGVAKGTLKNAKDTYIYKNSYV